MKYMKKAGEIFDRINKIYRIGGGGGGMFRYEVLWSDIGNG